MISKFKNFFNNIKQSNNFTFVIIIATLSLLVKIPGVIIGDLLIYALGLSYPPFISDLQLPQINTTDFIGAVIIAPPIETLLGQFLPITIISKFTKNNKILIIVSAIIFGLLHLPVLGFLFAAFFVGLLFSWGYIIKSKEDKPKAFLLISLSHATHNLIAFLLTLLLEI